MKLTLTFFKYASMMMFVYRCNNLSDETNDVCVQMQQPK